MDSSTSLDQEIAMSGSGKRTDYLSWKDYFMATAFLAAKRSKDPNTQVGACIVNQYNVIVGTGYNGMPRGCHDDKFSWRISEDPLKSKYTYVCHAEFNAFINKNTSDVRGCTIYTTLFPCNECAKLIIQSGIAKVVYSSDKYADLLSFKASKLMLERAEIEMNKYVPKNKIEIDFPKEED